jgi:hypothetical protein
MCSRLFSTLPLRLSMRRQLLLSFIVIQRCSSTR